MRAKPTSLSKAVATILGAMTFASALMGCELKTNAKRSADNSEQAAGNSTKLLDLNQWAYGDGRQGGSRDRRESAMKTMHEATSLEAKMASAAAYFAALEYQLYKDDAFREDDEAKRNRMMTDAVSEAMKVQKDFKKPSPGSQASLVEALQNPEFLDAFAFAGAMHKVSERQLEAAKKHGFRVKSMFDILSDALAVKSKAEADPRALSELPVHLYEALRESDDIIRLFQLRLNLFVGTALMNLGAEAVSMQTDEQTGNGSLSIKPSAVKLQDATDRLKAALQTKMMLTAAGVKAEAFAEVSGGLEKLNAALAQLPSNAQSMMNAESAPKLPQILEIRAIAAKLAKSSTKTN